MTLVFRSLTFVSDSAVDLAFDTDVAGETATFRFTVGTGRGSITAVSSPEFSRLYRQVPGPALPMWPERLVVAAHKARLEAIPDGEELRQLIDDTRRRIEAAWKQDQHDADR